MADGLMTTDGNIPNGIAISHQSRSTLSHCKLFIKPANEN